MAGVILGLLAALVIAMASRRHESRHGRLARTRMAADLPFAIELMAACLRAGRPLGSAVDSTASAVGGPLAERLTSVSRRLSLGADAADAWRELGSEPALAELARGMVRAADSGAPTARILTRLADDTRRTAHAAALAAARRVGVYAVAPLGLCFLPSFVLLGIVPVVAGLASQIVLP
ncbi:type II secretion system F family protein [Sinosporangium album]|nr:type II secretion system F family protein [Sinosporangium album]